MKKAYTYNSISSETMTPKFPVLIIETDQQLESWTETVKKACKWCLDRKNRNTLSSKAMAALILWLYNPSEWPNTLGFTPFDYARMGWARDLIKMRCSGWGPHQICENADSDIEHLKGYLAGPDIK